MLKQTENLEVNFWYTVYQKSCVVLNFMFLVSWKKKCNN